MVFGRLLVSADIDGASVILLSLAPLSVTQFTAVQAAATDAHSYYHGAPAYPGFENITVGSAPLDISALPYYHNGFLNVQFTIIRDGFRAANINNFTVFYHSPPETFSATIPATINLAPSDGAITVVATIKGTTPEVTLVNNRASVTNYAPTCDLVITLSSSVVPGLVLNNTEAQFSGSLCNRGPFTAHTMLSLMALDMNGDTQYNNDSVHSLCHFYLDFLLTVSLLHRQSSWHPVVVCLFCLE